MRIPTNFLQANLVFTGSIVPLGAEVTLGFRHSGFTGDPVDAAEAIYTAFTTPVSTWATADLNFDRVRVKYGPNATGPSAEFAASSTGGQSGDAVSPQCSILVRKSTATGGRQGRGRSYLPGMPESKVGGGGALDGTFRSDVQDDLDTAIAELDLLGLNFVLLHGDLDAPTDITAWSVDLRIATQRRRNRR